MLGLDLFAKVLIADALFLKDSEINTLRDTLQAAWCGSRLD
jgi:hypothetical protein